MTEIEWLASTDPQPMLAFLEGKVSDRKLRLFACACSSACCELLYGKSPDFSTLELFADNYKAFDEFIAFFWQQKAFEDDHRTRESLWARGPGESGPQYNFREAGSQTMYYSLLREPAHPVGYEAAMRTAMLVDQQYGWFAATVEINNPGKATNILSDDPEKRVGMAFELGRGIGMKSESDLLREVFGNPLRPAAVAPSWMTWNDGTVPRIAQAIYDEKAFDRLPILANALENCGCDTGDILNHLRGPGPHVRGCWVVDLLLGKK
jgi:hypothetical protein